MTEVYFEWWLKELQAKGLVLYYEREPQSFVLTNPVQIFYNQFKATKEIIKSFELYSPLTYTPDYKVVISEKLKNRLFGVVSKEQQILEDEDFNEIGSAYQNTIFYTESLQKSKDYPGCYEIWFDVKAPNAASNVNPRLTSTRDFKYVSRLMFDTHGIVVNKVVPIGMKTCLFGKTFMPKRYRYTDISGQLRKLKDYESGFRNLEQYLEIKKVI